jgi:hypothetical protein
MPERTLRLDGLANARDLGGLRRTAGGLTPRGVFFRSENVDWLSPAGWDAARAAGIRTVVDLRQPGERQHDRGVRPAWVTTLAVDLDGLDNDAFWADYWDNGLVGTALYYLPHLRAMPERAVAALTAIVSAPPGGVLFHCMGGRDRTGLIAMLLLAGRHRRRLPRDGPAWGPARRHDEPQQRRGGDRGALPTPRHLDEGRVRRCSPWTRPRSSTDGRGNER